MAASAVASPEQYLGEVLAREQTSLWADAWRRLKRNRLALVGAVYLTLLVLVALLAIVWTPYPVDHQGVVPSYAAPSLAGTPFPHLLGGDASARDILSRLMVGAQISLIVGVGTQIAVLAVGIPLGLVAGFYRGPIDAILTFIINVFYGIPDLLVALILVFVLSGGRPCRCGSESSWRRPRPVGRDRSRRSSATSCPTAWGRSLSRPRSASPRRSSSRPS
jgi:ABC-type dipeptide/oligopeptide/nickel transport system permease subunit